MLGTLNTNLNNRIGEQMRMPSLRGFGIAAGAPKLQVFLRMPSP